MAEQKIIDRIAKLVSLGDTTKNNSFEEASRAMEAAALLMARHGLSMSDINMRSSIKINLTKWESGILSQINTWEKYLYSAASELFDCRCYMMRYGKESGYKVQVTIAGEKGDVDVAVGCFRWLSGIVQQLARAEFGKSWTSSHRSFCEGFGAKVFARVKDIKAKVHQQMDKEMKESERQNNLHTSYAMVIADKKAALKEYLAPVGIVEKHGRRMSSNTDLDVSAYMSGSRAGKTVQLDQRKVLHGGTK